MKYKLIANFETEYEKNKKHKIIIEKQIDINYSITKDIIIDDCKVKEIYYDSQDICFDVFLDPPIDLHCEKKCPKNNDQLMQHLLFMLENNYKFQPETCSETYYKQCFNFWINKQ